MAYTNGIIQAPVDASDPYYVLGMGPYNNTYDVGYACGNTHGKTNKWSFYKPYLYDSIVELTETQINSINGGFNFSTYESLTDLKAALTNGNIWQYAPPDRKSVV